VEWFIALILASSDKEQIRIFRRCDGAGLNAATYQLTGYRIKQDIKNKRHTTILQVTGNIEGYQEPVSVDLNTPIRIHPTQEYQTRRDKFYKWVSLSEF